MFEKLITQKEFQEITGRSRSTQWHARKKGKLGHYKINGRIRYSEQHIQDFLESFEVAAETSKEQKALREIEKMGELTSEEPCQFKRICSICGKSADIDGSFAFRGFYGCPRHAARAALAALKSTDEVQFAEGKK
jgi:hypothetical protein